MDNNVDSNIINTEEMKPKSNRGKKDIIIIPLILLLIIGFIMVIVGFAYHVPSRYFSFAYDVYKYVGGDAYNGIIEASLRGGQIAGAMAAKAIYMVGGFIIMGISIIGIKLTLK